MSAPIHVCILGAGTMGSGIAAHLLNLGHRVTLFDVTAEAAREAWQRAQRVKPPHLYVHATADKVRLAGTDRDLALLADADWVIEAVVEKLVVKAAVARMVAPHVPPEALFTTNTSGLPIAELSAALPVELRGRFAGTHFFNPPRYLKLLELIPGPETDPATLDRLQRLLEDSCARRVVPAKDTPGFIANRFGMWGMFHAIHCAELIGISPEQADEITGPFLGRPKSGSFRLNDLVGLDVMVDIAQGLLERCPDDPHIGELRTPPSLAYLVENGWIGSKVGQGYYRKEGPSLFSLDLRTLAYREVPPGSLPTVAELGRLPFRQRIREALEKKDVVGDFLRLYLPSFLQYAAYLQPDISHGVSDFDRVMQWGFGWEMGPFQMIDAIGSDMLGMPDHAWYHEGSERTSDGGYRPLPKEPAYRTLTDYPLKGEGDGFRVRDLGEGVTAVSLTTKLGVLTRPTVAALRAWLESHEGPLVLASEARHFSVGFDLQFFLDRATAGDLRAVNEALDDLLAVCARLRALPSVAAIHGYALGGGLEIALSCSRIAADGEAMLGLPEAKVGLLPAGTGTSLLRLRHQESLKELVELGRRLAHGVTSTNAEEARTLGYLRAEDRVVHHPDRLITEARALALEVSPTVLAPWAGVAGPLLGMLDDAIGREGPEWSRHDALIGDKIKNILARPGSFDEALSVERQGFMALLAEGLTHARIRAMLQSGKPLRN